MVPVADKGMERNRVEMPANEGPKPEGFSLKWDIVLWLPGREHTQTLCSAKTMDELLELVRILASKWPDGPDEIIVKVREA